MLQWLEIWIILYIYRHDFLYFSCCFSKVLAFIGMFVNIFSGGLAGILLWIVFWFTIIVSGMIFLLSLCNAYNTMLNKFSIMVWLVRFSIIRSKKDIVSYRRQSYLHTFYLQIMLYNILNFRRGDIFYYPYYCMSLLQSWALLYGEQVL